MGKMSDLHIEISEFYGVEQPSQTQITEYMSNYLHQPKTSENTQSELEEFIKAIYKDPEYLHEVVVHYAMEHTNTK